jgi:hypothetical protein
MFWEFLRTLGSSLLILGTVIPAGAFMFTRCVSTSGPIRGGEAGGLWWREEVFVLLLLLYCSGFEDNRQTSLFLEFCRILSFTASCSQGLS